MVLLWCCCGEAADVTAAVAAATDATADYLHIQLVAMATS